MTRIELLNSIIDRHIECLDAIEEPDLTDTKKLTEILKAIMVLEQIKKIDGARTEFDTMSTEELQARIENLGE